ncbi:hypothetical protein niasHS_017834 [Heterodera schachtii]|uniref:BEACH-type PH domain-containing protein n=1 Tax=Heterodera schachtii TaxID=97005 RepID=A0ABD2I4U0_HETSC
MPSLLHSMFRCARVQGLDIMEGLLLFGKDHFYVVDGFTLLKTDLDFLPERGQLRLANCVSPTASGQLRLSQLRLIF